MERRFCLAICQTYNQYLHGLTTESDVNIDKYVMVEEVVEQDDFYDKVYVEIIGQILQMNTRIIRHYNSMENIVPPSLEIIQLIELSTGENVACIKTFWLKIIQRKWKKVFEKRKQKVKKLKYLNNFLKRERYGV
jgi:hypothetical protein